MDDVRGDLMLGPGIEEQACRARRRAQAGECRSLFFSAVGDPGARKHGPPRNPKTASRVSLSCRRDRHVRPCSPHPIRCSVTTPDRLFPATST